jgi:hypothetical protein
MIDEHKTNEWFVTGWYSNIQLTSEETYQVDNLIEQHIVDE